MEALLYTVNLMIVMAGFYALPNVRRGGPWIVGIAVSLGLVFTRALIFHDDLSGIPLYLVSCLLGAIPVFYLLDRYDGPLGYMMLLPLGGGLLMFGGPIEIAYLLTELNEQAPPENFQLMEDMDGNFPPLPGSPLPKFP